MAESRRGFKEVHGENLTKQELDRLADFLSQEIAQAIAGAVDALFAARTIGALASRMGHGDAERVWSRLGNRMKKQLLARMWDSPRRAAGDSARAPEESPLAEEVGAER